MGALVHISLKKSVARDKDIETERVKRALDLAERQRLAGLALELAFLYAGYSPA